MRAYVIDPDNFEGGRKQKLSIAGESLGLVEAFEEGRWLERNLSADQTAQGKVLIEASNARQGSNAVISILEWVEN